MERRRARQLGIHIGRLQPGAWNAITDVPGVRVGHATLVSGEGALEVGKGPVRTGVTVIIPAENIQHDPIFAGSHVLNGCGEMTGLAWIGESGLLSSVIATTNTFSVGAVHEALIHYGMTPGLPVVAETWDGWLSDIQGMHVRGEHVKAALDAAAGGPVVEGCIGGGTGMICHGFKGGIGTSSRVLSAEQGGWAVGVLVQANHGQRERLSVDGVAVGRAIPVSEIPDPYASFWATLTGSSIIVVLATDAPLLPHQCNRLAQRATLGVARVGGVGENTSGDIFLAFSTGNRGMYTDPRNTAPVEVRMLPDNAINPLFEAAADATEEAILNALCMATTMTGVDGRVAYALPLDRLQQHLSRHPR
jgi:D-aminopeptidase